MAKKKKAVKTEKRSAKKAKKAVRLRERADDRREEGISTDFARDFATAPPPKEIGTIKAANDAIQRGSNPAPDRDLPDAGHSGAASARPRSGLTGGAPVNSAANGAAPAARAMPGDALAAASRSIQSFAVDMQRMAKESIEQTAHILEQLRTAKSVEEVVSLQTTFLQQAFRRNSDFAKRIGELMSAGQATFLEQGRVAMRTMRSLGDKAR